MSVATGICPHRDAEYEAFSFSHWHGLEDVDKQLLKEIEDGIENCFGPSVHIDPGPAEDSSDVILHFALNANDYSGPCWNFSMREILEGSAGDCYADDVRDLAKALRAMADLAEKIASDDCGDPDWRHRRAAHKV